MQKMVGDITREQLEYVESFVSEDICIFIPSTGPCKYSTTPDHKHPGYTFILAHDDNGKVVIDGKEIGMKHGRIMAFSPGLVHHEVVEDDFSRYVAIAIDKDYFEREYERYAGTRDLFLEATVFDPPPGLTVYLKDFMYEYENKNPGFEHLLKALGLKITHMIIRKILNYNVHEEKINYRCDIDRVIEYIYDNYSGELNVDKMAGLIAFSPSHFSRVFKKETGVSPMDFLIRVRLNIAKKYLVKGEKNITEIALQCGFNSSSHFSSTFTRFFNITPSKFKEITLR